MCYHCFFVCVPAVLRDITGIVGPGIIQLRLEPGSATDSWCLMEQWEDKDTLWLFVNLGVAAPRLQGEWKRLCPSPYQVFIARPCRLLNSVCVPHSCGCSCRNKHELTGTETLPGHSWWQPISPETSGMNSALQACDWWWLFSLLISLLVSFTANQCIRQKDVMKRAHRSFPELKVTTSKGFLHQIHSSELRDSSLSVWNITF